MFNFTKIFKRKRSIGQKQENGDVLFDIKISDVDQIKLPYTLNGNVSYLNEFYEDLGEAVSGERKHANFVINVHTTDKTTKENQKEFTDSFRKYYEIRRISIHNEGRKNFWQCVYLGIAALILFVGLALADYFIGKYAANSEDSKNIAVMWSIIWDIFMVLAWVVTWDFFDRLAFKTIELKNDLNRNRQFLNCKLIFNTTEKKSHKSKKHDKHPS